MAKLLQTISLPSKIKVGSFDVHLSSKEGLSDIAGDEGSYHASKQLIVLDETIVHQNNAYSCLLVWHEILHVIFDQYALKGLDEENTVNGFSQGIVQVLRDNPQFKKWMDLCLNN